MINYYNKQGKEISMEEWGELHSDKKYVQVKLDKLPNGKLVSTVWLGLNHSFKEGGILIFETLIFSEGDDNCDMQRYATEEEAIQGHKEMVEKASLGN
jgi:hypothetical protein